MDRCSMCLLCWMCWLSGTASADTSAWHESLADDATLHDVAFVDAQYGWAVGDHGALWHTTDGGQNWQRQTIPLSANLGGVSFVDRNLGWCVGGKTSPYLGTSRATVLRTVDGGKTWEPQLALLPALEKVKFFDADHGVAWGRGSGGEPFGVFASDDSGRNWRPAAVGWQSAWSDGDFLSQHTGIVVGNGRAGQITNGDAARLDLGKHAIRAIRWCRADGVIPSVWAVGDEGTILRSSDGTTWKPLDVLPDDLASLIDWQTVATHGSHVWIAGSPGTVVLHSPDGGQTWQGHATASHAPIRKMTFVDEKCGWAVCDFGTILHTIDGGQSWQAQRRGGQRAAVLFVVADTDDFPFEALAKLASDGYRTVVHLASRSKTEPNALASGGRGVGITSELPEASAFGSDQRVVNPSHPARLAEALSTVGCTYPPSRRATLSGKTRTALQSGFEHLAFQLRLWRPAVLVVPEGDSELEESIDLAIQQAGDAEQLAHLTEQLALPPWQVSRVFAHLPPGQRGTHRVQSADIVPVADKSLSELATAARSLLNREFVTSPETSEFLLKASHAGEPTASVDDLAAGLSIQPGTDCRRPIQQTIQSADPETRRRLAEKRRNLANIFRFAEGSPALMAQVGQMMGDLAPGAAAALLVELAEQFELAGQIQLAVDTREMLVRRGGDDPLVEATLVWLVQFYASGETAHAYRSIATEMTEATALASPTSAVQPATALLETQTDDTTNNLAARRYTRAVQYAEHIAKTRPLLNAEPQLRVPAAVAERNVGTNEPAQRYLESLALRYPGEAWQECGAVERWLTEPDKLLPAKPRITCRFTGARPTLDGKLDEPLWQAKAIELSSPESKILNPKSEIFLAHDEEYLYLAMRCVRSPTATYSDATESRTYDADLSQNDRVQILIDLDRDYTTYFALTVDHRGWTNDACWQDKSWNPKWFVAAHADGEAWTVEAAIPWTELTDTPPKIGDAWAVAAERVVPDVGAQNLTGTTSSNIGPQQFGVLLFK